MMPKRSEKGSALLVALAALTVFAILLNVAAAGLGRAWTALQGPPVRGQALFEARGGVRWAEDRLSKEGRSGDLVRRDEAGILEVKVTGDRIRSTFTPAGGHGARAVEARWRRDGGIVIFEWNEE